MPKPHNFKLSAVIITLNEEANIGSCLKQLEFCDEVIVVDSGSIDQTRQIASKTGARVYEHPLEDFASQKNFGVEKALGDWILQIDADERVPEALASEIQNVLAAPKTDTYFLPRKNQIFGRWMKYGANRSDYQLRLAKKEHAKFSGKVHERIPATKKTGRLTNPILHFSTPTISRFMHKLNPYSTLESKLWDQEGREVSLKKLESRPLKVFLWLTFLKLGFMDGTEGIFFCILSAYNQFVSLAKQWELKFNREMPKTP